MRILKYNESYKDGELHYYAFDWDDNILYMPTMVYMDKKIDDAWVPVSLTTSEFATYRNDSNYRLRNNNVDETFCDFRDYGPRGERAFMDDTILALSNRKYGPSWKEFIESLIGGHLFAIITGRGHNNYVMRRSVEYIINNFLSEDQKFLMYNNCLLHINYLTDKSADSFDRIPKGVFTENPLIKVYLDDCDFFGVSSPDFNKMFGKSSQVNPEDGKKLAINHFINKCNKLGKYMGAKSVSVGFSDDDGKTIEHIKNFFKEKSALWFDDMKLKLSVYNTNDPNNSVVSKYISETTPGLEASVVPFSKWTSNPQWYYTDGPNSKDPMFNKMKNTTKLNMDLIKDIKIDNKKNDDKKKLKKKIKTKNKK